MANQFYVESADRPYHSGVANEAIEPGELVHDGGAGVTRFAFADGDYDGLAVYDPEYLSAEDEDAIASGEYAAGDRVRYQPDEHGAVLRARTLEDSGGPAPSISHGTVVGVIDDSAADAPSGVVGRLVEEGYTADINGDGTSTTFDRATGNFLAIGKARRPGKQNGETITAFDEPIRVELFDEARE